MAKIERENRGLIALNSFLAKIGVVYYMRLLTALYMRDPAQKLVRQLITKLFANQLWRTIPDFGASQF